MLHRVQGGVETNSEELSDDWEIVKKVFGALSGKRTKG